MTTERKVLYGIAVLVLVIALGVGGWLGGWWLQGNAVNRQGRITNKSFARQNALREDALDKQRTALDIDVQLSTAPEDQQSPLKAQRVAVVRQFCDDVVQMTDSQTPASVRDFANQECNQP